MLSGALRLEGICHNHRAPKTKWTENQNNFVHNIYMLNYSESVSVHFQDESNTISAGRLLLEWALKIGNN